MTNLISHCVCSSLLRLFSRSADLMSPTDKTQADHQNKKGYFFVLMCLRVFDSACFFLESFIITCSDVGSNVSLLKDFYNNINRHVKSLV